MAFGYFCHSLVNCIARNAKLCLACEFEFLNIFNIFSVPNWFFMLVVVFQLDLLTFCPFFGLIGFGLLYIGWLASYCAV